MKRYERVNFCGGNEQSLQNFKIHFRWTKDSIKEAAKEKLPMEKRVELSRALTSFFLGSLYYHFELPSPPIKAKVFINNAIETAIAYFYCGKKTKSTIIHWNQPFYFGTLFSLLKNDRESLKKIAEWVDHTVMNMPNHHPFDILTGGTINYFSPLFFVFAQYFRDVPRKNYSKEIESIKNGYRSSTKTLLNIWENIYTQNTDNFEKQLVQLVNKHIHKISGLKPPLNSEPINIISLEATWMWNIALRSGMEMPVLPEEIMDRIVTPQSIGLEK
ncbi:MAG: hypothetical protein LBC74_01830 [Planctomycetaceae bacterium]|nr:hypothetical protein [Planctomycetaceae bacterium]